MSKKLEIGKTEIVIYPERGGHTYVVPKDISGMDYEQTFNSSNLPEKLIAVYIGQETIRGVLHDKYILKEIPEELRKVWLSGETGFVNQSIVLDSVAGILRGEAEDGRKIKYVRSVIVEDINKLFNVIVDFKNKRVYQEGIDRNIDRTKNFGNSLDINQNFTRKEIEIIRKHIEGKYIESTAYFYSEKDLQAEEYLKKLIFLKTSYYLNSPGVYVDSGIAYFGFGAVYDGCCVSRGFRNLFNSNYGWSACRFSIRPVFYLEKEFQENKDLEILNKIEEKQEKLANVQKNIVKKQEKIMVLEKNIAKQQEELKKEKEELQKMVNEALELI